MSRRQLRQGERRRRCGLASLLTLALVLTMAVVGINYAPWAQAQVPAPDVTLTGQTPVSSEHEEVRPGIIAGQDAVFGLTISQRPGGGQFNTSVTVRVPNKVDFVEASSLLGTPTIYESGAPLPDAARDGDDPATVPEDSQVWVWENIADLPVGATIDEAFTVRPHANAFPVGASLDLQVHAYTSSDESLLPSFPGSSGVSTDREHTSEPGTDSEDSLVRALRIHKSEPSPESELLRGVHNNATVYTLQVLHTSEGSSDTITVTDYLPAGLEYLGDGGVDNTDESDRLFGETGDREYPGADDLTHSPELEHYREADTVETVELQADEASDLGLGENAGGVYTKVTWTLHGDAFTGGRDQQFPEDAGEPGFSTIQYLAAVPLFENTMDFDGDTPGTDGAQAANLNNNNGPSTRHGTPDSHEDASSYTNVAHVSGEYQGEVADGASSERSDSSTEVIDAVDLRILKDVDPTTYEYNEFATFSLNLATSEYIRATDLVITDELDNGLCPALPEGADGDITFEVDGEVVEQEQWNEEVGDVCEVPTSGGGAVENATVTGLLFEPGTGTFAMTMRVADMDDNAETEVSYTVRQNEQYFPADHRNGPVVSGDAVSNTVEVQATTHPIDALDGVEGVGEEYLVWEDSAASIDSTFTAISKQVLPRDGGGPLAEGADWQDSADGFIAGDTAWYRLQVDFPDSIDTRNPVITDFLPRGVEFQGDDDLRYRVNSHEVDDHGHELLQPPGANGNSLRWELGAASDNGIRYVPAGTDIEIFVPVTVTDLSAHDDVDMPQNLMKYRQENTEGEVFFLRDDAEITVDHGMTLVKGVADVDGEADRDADSQTDGNGEIFGSDRDGIQVVQGETVTYRLDLTTPPFPTTEITVWDVLPDDITDDAVENEFTLTIENGTYDVTVLAPGDDGYPALGDDLDERHVIVWTIHERIDADTDVTLTYDVTVPEGTLAETRLDNIAGIASYGAETNQNDNVTYVPDGPFANEPGDEEFDVPREGTFDDSWVYLPGPTMEKNLVSTEIPDEDLELTDPNNADDEIVQGEYVTFAYSVNLPANTSVAGGVLADDGHFAYSGGTVDYEFVEANVVQPEGLPAGFELHVDTEPDAEYRPGTLTFPETYDIGDEDQTFTVEITMWVADADATDPEHEPALAHDTELTNTARFSHEPPAGGEEEWPASDTVDYIEPNLQITKSADQDTDLRIGSEVTYTIQVSNPGNRPIAYDNTVVDTVPEGLEVQLPITDGGVWNEDLRTITWDGIEQVPAADGEPIEFSYTVIIGDQAAGAESYDNTVEVTGHTLPDTLPDEPTQRRGDRTASDTEAVTTIDAGIAKGMRLAETEDDFTGSTTVPAGDTVEYQVVVTLEPWINYWDPVITDTLPEGVQIQDATVSGPTASDNSIGGTWDYEVDGNIVTWTYDGDITSSADERTLLLTYQALVTDGEDFTAADELENTAGFSWNRADDNDDTRTDDITDDAVVNLVHPVLEIAKSVNDQPADAVEPGENFTYDLVVTNDGDTPAYNIVVTDEVPAGVIVDPDSISDGGVLTGADENIGGGTITWNHSAEGAEALNGPLHPAGSEEPQEVSLSYGATLALSSTIGDEDIFTNTAQADEWESFEDGGRTYTDGPQDTAVVTPQFPNATVTKETVGDQLAYVGEPFSWQLTAENVGAGAANQVVLTDELPDNWEYTSTTSIVVAGTAQTGDLEPAIDGQVLTWTFDGDPVLPPGETILVTFEATPGDDAVDETGSAVVHTNNVSVAATDTSNSPGNRERQFEDSDDEDAYIHAADLALTKTGAEEPIIAGADEEEVVGWTIEVTNNGPDTAVGPFTVSDTTGALPEGLTIDSVSGTGWTSTVPQRGEDGVTTFTVTRTDAEETLAAGQSLPEIEVTVSVDAAVEPTTVGNDAVVSSTGTHDPNEENDRDRDPLEVITEADLEIEKVVNSEEPNAGEAITWQLNPRNNGPSVSQSTDEDPIEVTDTIPDGIFDVTEERINGGDDWTVSASGGFPASAGDTLTFTYSGAAMPVDAAASITITGTIDPSWTLGDSLTNIATITPGPTEDPNGDNNEDDVTVTPGTDTSLSISKTRVVQSGGEWVEATDAPIAGESVSYRVEVTNHGPADAQNVTVADTLPDELTYEAFESVEGTWVATDVGGTGDQSFALTEPGALAPDASASLVITATLAADFPAGEAVINWAQAEADNSTNEPEDSDDSSSDRNAALEIEKSGDAEAVAGESIDYALTVTNTGPSNVLGPVVVTDELPAGFSYQSGSSSHGEPAVDGQTLTWTVRDADSSIEPGWSTTVTFTADIAADTPAQGEVLNRATVEAPEDDETSGDDDDHPSEVSTQADMTITKDVEDGPWVAGTEVTYTFTVTNAGPSVADAQVSELWPTGLTGISIDGAGWDCEDGTCTFEQHPVDTTTLTVVGEIDQAVQPGAELENTARLTWTDSRGSHDDEDTETVEVSTLADLELVKTAVDEDGTEIDTATAGERARYLLEVTNHGPSQAAAPITVTDTLPEGVSYVGLAGDTPWDVEEIEEVDGQQNITFTLGDGEVSLAAGAEAPDLTLIVHLDAGLPTTDEPDVPALVNTAVVSSPTEDPDETNNDDEAPLEVEQAADLAITKSHQGEAAIGEDLTFDVIVTNLGPSEATGITVTDTIPAGLDYVGHDGSDEAWTQVDDPVSNDDGTTTVTFALEGTLDVEEQAPTLMVTTTVTAAAYPEVTNVVVVDGDQPDRNPGNNEDPDNVIVPPLADLGIVKTLDGDGLTVGEAATYTLVVTNHGPTEHVGQIAITDELPTGLVATDVQSEGTECEIGNDGSLVECLTEETLAVDDTLTVTIMADVQAGAWTAEAPEATNVATVTGTSEGPEEENNTSTVITPVNPDVLLELEKTRASADGASVDWEITVSSVGLNDAIDGAVVVDDLPDELRFDGVTSEADVTCSAGAESAVECPVTGPIAAGDSVTMTLHTTLLAEDTAVTNTAWLVDPETGEVTPEGTDSADYRPGALSVTGASVGALVALALLLLTGGAFLVHRTRRA